MENEELIKETLKSMLKSADVTNMTYDLVNQYLNGSVPFDSLVGNEELIMLYKPVFLEIYRFKTHGDYIPNIFVKDEGAIADGDKI